MNNIEKKVVDLLIKKKLTITTAESCTGGLLASSIISVSNASKVFNQGYITYSNESKVQILGVSNCLINEVGVVSEDVTKQMAIGAARTSKANVAIVTSGIAGPTGGSTIKPVGMVCFGIYLNGETYTYTYFFGNIGRNLVRKESKEYIFEKLYMLLKKI